MLSVLSNKLSFLLNTISNMDHPVENSELKINRTPTQFSRSAIDHIAWDQRLIAIRGTSVITIK